MTTYLISYDLRKQGQNYASLHEAIKQLGPWWHYLESTWLVKYHGTAVNIRDVLAKHLDGNDSLLVTGLSGEAAWKGFSSDCSEWLQRNL